MPPLQTQPLQPLLASVLAVLKAAQEHGHEITRTKLVKLLYFADLAAVEDGGTEITGATWRWDNYGPYDTAIRRAEDATVAMDLVDRDDRSKDYEYGSCHLELALHIDDPLPEPSMGIIRRVVAEHGDKHASWLRNLSYETAPMVEVTAAGDRQVRLDLSLARRSRQAKALLDRHRRLRAAMPTRQDDSGVGDDLLEEMQKLAPLRGHVNAEELKEQ